MERRHLQPNNATAYERAISEAMDRAPELSPAIVALRGFKFDPPDAIVPYLIREYGLTEIEDYLPDLRTVLKEGLTWQRLRGTPAALHRALGWIGHDGVLEENSPKRFKWWWFQIHLPEPRRSSRFVSPMTAVANASKPLRSEIARITAGYDKRGFVLNAHRVNGGALLNSWSGIRRGGGEPALSLRWNHIAPVFANTLYNPGITGRQSINHTALLSAGPSTTQKSSFPQDFSFAPADYSDPDTVPFSNAPFPEDKPFGAPIPQIQKDY